MEFFEFDESFVAKEPDQSAILDVMRKERRYEGTYCSGYLSKSGNANLGGIYYGASDVCANATLGKTPDTKTTTNLKPFIFDSKIKK